MRKTTKFNNHFFDIFYDGTCSINFTALDVNLSSREDRLLFAVFLRKISEDLGYTKPKSHKGIIK